MREVFAALGSEVFRPLVTLVMPGFLGISSWVVALLWNHRGIREFCDKYHTEFILAVLFLSVFFGLILDDVGSCVEKFLDRRALKKDQQHGENWYRYLRQAFRIEAVGHRRVRLLVLMLKFELNGAIGCVAAAPAAFFFLVSGWTVTVIVFVYAVFFAYFLCMACTSHEALARLREEMLKGVTVVPPEKPAP